MNDDEIVAEVRQARAQMLESYKGDYQAMMRALMAKQWNSGHQVVSLVDGKLLNKTARRAAKMGSSADS